MDEPATSARIRAACMRLSNPVTRTKNARGDSFVTHARSLISSFPSSPVCGTLRHRSHGGRATAGGVQMMYCVVPQKLARKLHGTLDRHFREDDTVTVIVEQRDA